MSNVQHTYHGYGNPNYDSDFDLTGDAVGLHHYLCAETGNIWMSRTWNGEHDDWVLIYEDPDYEQPAT